MPQSKAHLKATQKWEEKAYDKTLIRLKKGQLDAIKAHAVKQGESVNGFINRAINETMDREGANENE
jgi:predicted HicB family RNase H-like nuclease